MGFSESLHGVLPSVFKSNRSASSTLSALAKKGLLESAPLYPGYDANKHYHHLSAEGAARLGEGESIAGALSKPERIKRFAILSFACLGEVKRQVFTKQEFKEQLSMLWYDGQPTEYYLHEYKVKKRTRRVLSYLKVDTGLTSGRWDRVIQSCQRFVMKRTNKKGASKEYHDRMEAFRGLIERGEFQITLLTATNEKARRINQTIERRKELAEHPPPVVAYSVDGLLEVIQPPPRAPVDA